LISYYIWYPDGFNMAWVNSVPSAALLMWPVTLLGNAVVSHNVLSFHFKVGSAQDMPV
jgi:hypothetical protein